jgi:hypothetical protein
MKSLNPYQPSDLRFNPKDGLWMKDVPLLGTTIQFSGTERDQLCQVINQTIHLHVGAHNVAIARELRQSFSRVARGFDWTPAIAWMRSAPRAFFRR